LDLFAEPITDRLDGPSAQPARTNSFGCVLGCDGFTTTLPAVEDHERKCHLLVHSLPKGMEHDLFKGNEDKLVLPLNKIVEGNKEWKTLCVG